jgi:carboxypeptidase A2
VLPSHTPYFLYFDQFNYEINLNNEINFFYKIRFSDIGKHIEDEERAIILRRAMHSGRAFDFENYHTYSEV